MHDFEARQSRGFEAARACANEANQPPTSQPAKKEGEESEDKEHNKNVNVFVNVS
jgi:hypothetical protein